MIVVGQRLNEKAVELHFESGGETLAVVRESCIASWHVSLAVTGTGVITAKLEADPLSGIHSIPNGGYVLVWVESPEKGRTMLGRFQIDYFAKDSAEQVELEIHGRGPLAPLIDSRWNLEYQGSLSALFEAELATWVPIAIRGVPDHEVAIYVDAPSMYGALRLITISTDCLVMEEMNLETVAVRSTQLARQEEMTKEPVTITDEDIVSSSTRMGSPVRRRGE